MRQTHMEFEHHCLCPRLQRQLNYQRRTSHLVDVLLLHLWNAMVDPRLES